MAAGGLLASRHDLAKYSRRAARIIAWAERFLKVPEGTHRGKPLVIADFMREDLELIFGNPAGTRMGVISRGRKSAKSVEAAIIILAYLAGPEVFAGSQLYSAANSRQQAAVVFRLMRKMVLQSPTLSRHLKIRDHDSTITNPSLDIVYRALSADSSTAHGLSPLLVVVDELGQVKAPNLELLDALLTGSAGQSDPKMIVISTQAANDNAVLSRLIDSALASNDPHTVIRVDTAPMDWDPFDIKSLELANPALYLFQNREELRKMVEKARNNPSWLPVFRNLHLNQRVSTHAPFVPLDTWKKNGGPVMEDWTGRKVWAAFDLATVRDLCAFVMVCEIDGQWQVRTYAWLPEQGLDEKSRADKTPWDEWHRSGFLRATPGPTTDYRIVASDIFDLCQGLDIQAIAYDQYRYSILKPWLAEAGFRADQLDGDSKLFHKHGQGFGEMSSALNVLDQLLSNHLIAHGNHPVLSVCASNATVLTDASGNRRLDKASKNSTGRIDALVAMAMALNIANAGIAPAEKAKSYLADDDQELIFA